MRTDEEEREIEIAAAITALEGAEKHLADIDRKGLLKTLEDVVVLLEQLPQVQHELRIARIRLQARLKHDPDRTPVEPLTAVKRDPTRRLSDPVLPVPYRNK